MIELELGSDQLPPDYLVGPAYMEDGLRLKQLKTIISNLEEETDDYVDEGRLKVIQHRLEEED